MTLLLAALVITVSVGLFALDVFTDWSVYLAASTQRLLDRMCRDNKETNR